MKLAIILWGIPWAMRVCSWVYPKFAEALKERDAIAQFRTRGQPMGRWIQVKDGKISSGAGFNVNPDFTIFFKDRKTATDFLMPPFDHLERIHAAKNFYITCLLYTSPSPRD